jgi:hypothetical protein
MERRFRVWRSTNRDGMPTIANEYNLGEVYTLDRDDKSDCPKFTFNGFGPSHYIYMHDLEEIDVFNNIVRRFDVGSTYTNPIDLPIPVISTQEKIAKIEKELAELKKSLEPKKVEFIPGKAYKSNKGRVVVCSSDDDEYTFSGVQLTFPGKGSVGITSSWTKSCFHPVEIQVIDSTE